MFINIIKTYRTVIAVCDKELIGKKFEQGLLQLDIKESFYKGEEGKQVSEEEATNLMESFSDEDATFNIVGKKSVACALKCGVIEKEGIKTVQGIPFALSLM
jgi:hypothetical protein